MLIGEVRDGSLKLAAFPNTRINISSDTTKATTSSMVMNKDCFIFILLPPNVK
jgi:hypothetical protein